MKITNFRNYESNGKGITKGREYTADVDVTTGFFGWKKTVTRQVKRPFCEYWFFVDTGKYTPGAVVEQLARSYKAQHDID